MVAGQPGTEQSFPWLLRLHRERSRLTQQELAERTQLSVRAIRDLEHGRTRHPHRDSVRRLADALGLDGRARGEFEAAARAIPGPVAAAAAPSPQPAVPHQLPPSIADFTGRAATVARLREMLLARVAFTPIVVLTGAAGVGKTTLAMHVAHTLLQEFPGGQLFAALHGTSLRPADSGRVLARLLHTMQVEPAPIPEDLEERTALLRTLVVDRRVLVVLDDAADEEQVRPLLPSGSGCAVLITSRQPCGGLEGALSLTLGPFDPQEAVELLGRIAGAERIGRQLAAARDIASACGHLPLAIRIAGARLLARPRWRLERLAALLASEHRRLDELVAGDLDLRERLERSYRALGAEERVAFHRIGLLDARELPAWVIAALADVPPRSAERLVDRLVETHMLDVTVAPAVPDRVRYRLNDVLHAYARERAEQEPATERRGALARAFGGWLALAEEAASRLPGELRKIASSAAPRWNPARSIARELLADPLVWFGVERAALVATTRQAARVGMVALAWDLTASIGPFLELRGHLDDWRACLTESLEAARRQHDRRGEAWMLRDLGELYLDENRYREALEALEAAGSIMEACGDRLGSAHVVRATGVALRARGEIDAARAHHAAALAVFEEAGDEAGRAEALFGLATIHREQGRLDEALGAYEQCLRTFQRIGDRLNEAYVHCNLGMVHRLRGGFHSAGQAFEQSLALCRQLGHQSGEALALAYLGELALARGESAQARRLLSLARLSAQEAGDRFAEAYATHHLGRLHLHEGQLERAGSLLGRALALWAQQELPQWRLRSQEELARVRAAAGDHAATRAKRPDRR